MKKEKDFNEMLKNNKNMPEIRIVSDPETIRRYGGTRMLLAPPLAYDKLIKQIPFGKVLTISEVRAWLAEQYGADFTDPMTAGIFIQIAAFANEQRCANPTPWWRVLKSGGELNPKYPGGVETQRARLEQEGHKILLKGRKNTSYYVADFESTLYSYAYRRLEGLPALAARE